MKMYAGTFEMLRWPFCNQAAHQLGHWALHDDDNETVKGFSDDGHSYAGTVVRGH